jgi:hypothetical protein
VAALADIRCRPRRCREERWAAIWAFPTVCIEIRVAAVQVHPLAAGLSGQRSAASGPRRHPHLAARDAGRIDSLANRSTGAPVELVQNAVPIRIARPTGTGEEEIPYPNVQARTVLAVGVGM